MTDAVLFNGLNALDFQDIRYNVIRIPEVNSRISEAQSFWDRFGKGHFNFHNFLAADNTQYMRNIHLKSLASSVVQVGLFDRYMKNFKKPEYILGNSNGDTPLKVAVDEKGFLEMIEESEALKIDKPSAHLQIAEDPVLSGITLSEFEVYKHSKDEKSQKWSYQKMDKKEMDISNLVTYLVDEHKVSKFVNIGPGNILLDRVNSKYIFSDIQILESIDLDPMLSWFWSEVQKPESEKVTRMAQ